jgi:hypothetical protein
MEVPMLRAIPIAMLAAAVAACGSTPPPSEAPVAIQSTPLQAGTGVITQVFPAPPNAGPVGGDSGMRYQRLQVRMDDGRSQFVDVPITEAIGEFARGMRVQITDSAQIRRL